MTFDEYKKFYLPFVLKNKIYIHDIYTTIRLEPFTSDAMGGDLNSEELVAKSLYLQKETGINISATFNNININPSFKNLELFIQNFTPLYNAGIRNITMPIYHWMLSKKIQNRFPKLKIKNSILSKVSNPREFWDAAQVGYDVVNIDRNLLRDQESLKQIKKTQGLFFKKYNKYVKTQILPNEQCIGHCPARTEHYNVNFNNSHYFGNELSTLTCRSWEKQDPHYDYKRAVASPFWEDFNDILKYIDIFKMFGRDGKTMLKQSFLVIDSYINKNQIIPTFPNAMKIKEKNHKEFNKWRNTTKNCRFECFDCDICNSLEPLI
ncbi:MAG: hypothetical protein ACQERD_04035 [Campylobacterota bacterium]